MIAVPACGNAAQASDIAFVKHERRGNVAWLLHRKLAAPSRRGWSYRAL